MKKTIALLLALVIVLGLLAGCSSGGGNEANSLLKTDADSAADIFQVASGGIPELSQKGLLLPLVYDTSVYSESVVSAVTGDDGMCHIHPASWGCS